VRDGLLDIMSALEAKDVKKAREVLGKLDALVGPHFRFEEEALYPALKVFLGEYIYILYLRESALTSVKKGDTFISWQQQKRWILPTVSSLFLCFRTFLENTMRIRPRSIEHSGKVSSIRRFEGLR